MLIDDDRVLEQDSDPVMREIYEIMGGNKSKKLQTGIYERDGFNAPSFMRGEYEEYPELGESGPYGVCDSVENLLEHIPALKLDGRQYIVFLCAVERDLSNKGNGGGWRWHKWGEYIGNQKPTTEYLDDEPEIEKIYCYHIHEKIPLNAN